MAEKRLSSLKRKLEKNKDLHQKYVDGMSDLLEQGYAVPVPEQDVHRSDGKVWYLPHHPVINPNKEKIRIVFDCAAEYGGVSLNSRVRQGPDLTNKLVGVLTRFRLNPIAVMADIQAMFHQVRVTRDDQDTLRFLWWPEGNLSEFPMSYKMTVHLFGGTWSPSCCTYALRRIAKDNAGSYSPAAVETITQNFYVDDCLKSMPTVSEAISLVSELKMLVAEGGFNLTKWTSNSPDVISKAPNLRPISKDDPEVKEAVTFTAQTTTTQSPVDKLIDGISNWTQLVRSVACFTLIPEVHRRKTRFTGLLGPEHLQQAENLLIRHVQSQCYSKEIKAIAQGSSVSNSSPLIRLRPELHDGILVVPGRLTHANLPSRAKKPVILPSRHPMVESLVRHVHERTAHSGRGYALAELRRKYWIVGATSLVKKVIRHCVTCRRRDAQPCQQMEADLPLDRVTPHEPVFTSVGVDYFGPFAVKRGRGREKRYGCLFTCLTTRAVHIETADTLDTNSFINCLYRFMARRGEPRLIRSDNGTNFVGAERELRKEMETMDSGVPSDSEATDEMASTPEECPGERFSADN